MLVHRLHVDREFRAGPGQETQGIGIPTGVAGRAPGRVEIQGAGLGKETELATEVVAPVSLEVPRNSDIEIGIEFPVQGIVPCQGLGHDIGAVGNTVPRLERVVSLGLIIEQDVIRVDFRILGMCPVLLSIEKDGLT